MLIPLKEQLRDRLFRKWMAKEPQLKVVGRTAPWVVYVQRDVDNSWARKLFLEYREAYQWVAAHLHDFPDLTLNCKRQSFKPPIIIGDKDKPVYRLPELKFVPDFPHIWCPYCRRLSIFKSFSRHHAINTRAYLRYIDRCMICGIPLSFVKRYHGS